MPQHVFCSLRYSFLVDQVFWTDVFRDGVTAPGTAAQRQRRSEFKVVQVTDTTLRRWGVDQDTRGFHLVAEEGYAFRLVILVGVQTRGVTDTAHGDQFFRFADGVFKVFGAIHSQRWRQFFVSERF
ncbi:hypothetical protein D3C80_1278030 [compost metagenome]